MICDYCMDVGDISVKIVRKSNLKNLYIRVLPPDGDVTVSSPQTISDEDIRLYVLKKLPEITKVKEHMLSQARQSKREYVSGESYYLWGRPYRLQVIYEGTHFSINKTPTKIILYAPKEAKIEEKGRAFTEWYRNEMKRALESVVMRCEKRTGIYANEVRIKNMRTRWGTCNIDKQRIWLNLQLVKKPPECLEYVMIHELVHLVEKNHTRQFYALVEKYCPEWKGAKNMLEKMPLDYLEKRGMTVNGMGI